MARLTFLKLGGSLLGDKRAERSFRRAVVERLAGEIRSAMAKQPDMRLLMGHGGGGAAHFPAKRNRTREGLPGGGGWRGAAETRRGVLTMNARVLDALAAGDLWPMLVSPVAGVAAVDGAIRRWDCRVIQSLLEAGRIPLIHGDVVVDESRGFTICSTEELFAFLAGRLKPARIVLACDVEGVYFDTAALVPGVEVRPVNRRKHVVRHIHRGNAEAVCASLRGASAAGCDVTGGITAKVTSLLAMCRRRPGLEARIVSGLTPGNVADALLGHEVGTAITWEPTARVSQ